MKKILLFLTLFMGIINSMVAQWLPTEGTKGANVKSIVASGTKLYMANNDGVYLSSDNGNNWSRLGDDTQLNVDVLAVTPSTIYAGGSSGLYGSTDNGNTWQINATLPPSMVTMISAKNNGLYVGTLLGLYFSSDNGKTWTLLSTDVRSAKTLTLKGADIYVLASDNIFISSDSGISWRKIRSLPSRSSSVGIGLEIRGSAIYVTTYGGMYLSIDEGASWAVVGPFYNVALYNFFVDGDKMFAVGYDGLYISLDGGSNWVLRSIFKTQITAVAVVGTTIFAGNNGELYKSTDNGATWTTVSGNGLKDTYFSSLATDGTISYAATPNGHIYTSTNEGANWLQANNNLKPSRIGSLAIANSTVFVGANSLVYATSTNAGNWSQSTIGLTGYVANQNFSFLPQNYQLVANGANLFAGGYGVSYSVNNGYTWKKSGSIDQNWSINILATSGTTIYAAGFKINLNDFNALTGEVNAVFESNDNGITWKSILTTNYNISGVAAIGQNVFVSTNKGLFLTQNSGNSWSEPDIGLVSPSISAITTKDNTIFAAINNKLYYSTNNGQNWRTASDGLPTRTTIPKLMISGKYLFAGTNTGIFRRLLSEFKTTGTTENTAELTCTISPNPVSNVLTINCSNALVGRNYSIKNILGETIQSAILSNNSTQLNVQNFANGIYFLTLIGTNKTVKFVKE